MKNITIEQKAHDLTVSYITNLFSQSSKYISPEDFVQEYNNTYDLILKAVKKNS